MWAQRLMLPKRQHLYIEHWAAAAVSGLLFFCICFSPFSFQIFYLFRSTRNQNIEHKYPPIPRLSAHCSTQNNWRRCVFVFICSIFFSLLLLLLSLALSLTHTPNLLSWEPVPERERTDFKWKLIRLHVMTICFVQLVIVSCVCVCARSQPSTGIIFISFNFK